VSHTAYSRLPGVNWSTLRYMLTSPLHYHYRRTHPPDDSPAMRLGRAVHCAVLEPDMFPLEFVVYDGARRGAAWTEFAGTNATRDILTISEYETALGIRDAVHLDPHAAKLLQKGEAERVVEWTDAGTGLACKGRLDYLTGRTVVDLKTTKDITPRAFSRTCDRFRYVSQLGFYRDGVREELGIEAGAALIAVESDPPHDVAVYTVSSDDLWNGSDEAHTLLERVAACEASGEWPGAYPERQALELPPWTWGEGLGDEIRIIEGVSPLQRDAS
jgi:exodeoxyribonuclease VIII